MDSNSSSVSESESDLISDSNSLSDFESVSNSLSSSTSESISSSIYSSESLSTSESTANSESSSTSMSSSYETSVLTSTAGGDIGYRRVVVDSGRAPLQVAPRQTETVEDDITPKSSGGVEYIKKEQMPKSTLDVAHRVWWSWIPIVGTLVSMNETRKRRKEEKKAAQEAKEDEENNKN